MKHFRAFLCAAAGLAVFLLAFGQDVSPTAEPTERSTVEPTVVLEANPPTRESTSHLLMESPSIPRTPFTSLSSAVTWCRNSPPTIYCGLTGAPEGVKTGDFKIQLLSPSIEKEMSMSPRAAARPA